MKNKFLISVGAMLLLTSCGDFLSKSPDNRTNLDSPAAVSELLVSAYPESTYSGFLEAMSDNAGDKGLGQYVVEYQPNTNSYFWKDENSDGESATDYWNGCYAAIAHSNQALKAIEEASDKELYRAQRGEALITRAYAHFMLVNIFGKHYDPKTCSTDLGVPYVTEPEDVVYRKYERETVGTIYKNIEADMLEAIDLVMDENYVAPKYHFTKAAVYAFASRFYLYKGEWDKVIDYSDKVLGENPVSKLRDWNGKYSSYDVNELWATYTKSEEPANILLARAITDWPSALVVIRYSLSMDKVIELFQNAPIENYKSVVGDKVVYAGNSEQCALVPKLPRRMQDMGGNMGLPNTICPLFTMEEVLFNRAEAYTMIKEYDKALRDLDFFNAKRVSGYKPENPKIDEKDIKDAYLTKKGPALAPFYTIEDERQKNLIWYLLDMRRREFIHEGLRWFDIKRFNFEIQHKEFGKDTPMVLPINDPRRLLQIPASAISSGVVPNPR